MNKQPQMSQDSFTVSPDSSDVEKNQDRKSSFSEVSSDGDNTAEHCVIRYTPHKTKTPQEAQQALQNSAN